MKHCYFLFVIFHLGIRAVSQSAAPFAIVNKPAIDSAAIANWADLLSIEPVISNDGKYFMYQIENLPPGNNTLVIQETEGSWKKEFIGAEKGFFSANSKQAVFKAAGRLYFLPLGKNDPVIKFGVTGYKMSTTTNCQWLAYQVKGSDGYDLIVNNLLTGKNQQYSTVSEYQFDNEGKVLLLKKIIKNDKASSELIQWINLSNNKLYTVWQSSDNMVRSANGFQFDEEGKQLVFIVQSRANEQATNAVWYYREGMEKAVEKVHNASSGIDSDMVVSNERPFFSVNGKYIFFKIEPSIAEPSYTPNPDAVQVDVWSYKDKYPGDNPNELRKDLASVISVEGSKIICLEKKGVTNVLSRGSGDFAIVSHRNFIGDQNWLKSKEPIDCYLISLKDGTKKHFNTGTCVDFAFTRDGQYFIYFESNNFFSYDLSTGKTLNISANIPESISEGDINDKKIYSVGIKGYLDNNTVIIYDNFDIWKVDVTGKRSPVNLTNGYGKLRRIKFRLLQENNLEQCLFYPKNEPLLLVALDVENKYNGFFRINPNKAGNPEQLTMGAFLYCTKSSQQNVGLYTMNPIKANNVDYWIVKRQTASDAPNFFLTKNFKEFKQLTNVQPQQNYNWFTSELITWKQNDGRSCQGILYKPSNFDSGKKYPVIVNYYEKRSDQLHQFLRPDFIQSELNIPWFASRGYVVFVPDIYFIIRKTGESVVNSVVSGVKHLYRYPFIDSARIGIHGHSFGGYETNYLVTHTNIFAAAIEGAGASNFISYYGTLRLPRINANLIEQFEGGQYGTDANPWQDMNAFIENSPIFDADKVSTPLLIMHNKKDDQVPWSQAVEFFIALRRLNKKVWMLQYDKGGHGVHGINAEQDYTTRMTQFFDHYLKGLPAPKWMTKGIPATLKGVETGYQLSDPNEIP